MVVYFIVETAGTGKVLTESVVGKQYFVFNNVCEHAVWPMQHRRFKELEGFLAQFKFVA